jgi:hypothetical protein
MNTNLLNLSCDASKALAEIWMSRLEIISDATGINMSVLLKCVDMQIPTLPKKRAPPSKKNTDEEKEQAIAKKAAEALAKKEQAIAKKAADAIAKKEQAIANKALALAMKEQAIAKKAAEALAKKENVLPKKKNAPKTKPTVKASEEPRQEQMKPAKFKHNEKVVYIRPSGVEVDSTVEYVLQYSDRVEYRLQVNGTNEIILAAEENVRENCDDDEESECSKTVMMSEDQVREAEKEECQLKKRSEIFLANGQQQIQAERIIMNGVAYLIGNNDIAYLESSKKMVGKYDYEEKSIRQLYSSEYDEYYGKSDSEEESDEDECPVISDMSDSDSD